MGNGNPRCENCHGRGVVPSGHGYVKCRCVSGTAAQRAAVRSLFSAGATRDPNKPLIPRDDDRA